MSTWHRPVLQALGEDVSHCVPAGVAELLVVAAEHKQQGEQKSNDVQYAVEAS